jgi:hypothetical protein
VELNEKRIQKLVGKTTMTSLEAECIMPCGRERVAFYFGEGFEPILICRGVSASCCPTAALPLRAPAPTTMTEPAPGCSKWLNA